MNARPLRKILRIDASARTEASVSRTVGDAVVDRLAAHHPGVEVARVDLADGVPHIDASWVEANLTPAAARTPAQRERLADSDAMVAALAAADALVLTVPIYNFSVPSVLKAWIDHVCRAGLTFRYTSEGPQGLLADRPVYLVMASGGVAFGSAVDFASTYLRQVLRFIGIEDVHLIGAERVAADAAAAQAGALARLDALLPLPAGQVA